MKNIIHILKRALRPGAEKFRPLFKRLRPVGTAFNKLRQGLAPLKEKLRRINENPLLLCIILAFTINLVVEMLSRRSFTEGLAYFAQDPFLFIINVMIIFLTLSISFLFKRRLFIVAAVSTVWTGLGIANYIILGHRNTPLGALDFTVLKSVTSILNVYLSTTQIVLIVVALVAIITVFALAWRKVPKQKTQYVRSVSTFVVSTLIIVSVMGLSIKGQALSTNFGNVVDAYDKYGFAYCFSCSVVASGISKPDDYNPARMSEILADIDSGQTNQVSQTPNVILLQLESFFDPNYLKGLTYSENPVPFFDWLKENYSSGFLTVPGVGAGTANTEFEVLTGMNLDFFGPGEYPYTTVLSSQTTETINYNLKAHGYYTHAIHNHTGTFYTRNEVYPQLGFDEFTPIECMGDIVRNPLNWAKDSMLVKEITDAISATQQQDFVFAVSVQGHGKYPDQVIDPEQTITISGIEDEGRKNAYEYYVNQLHEMDLFLQDLTAALSEYPEPVVLVLYGDHLPGLEIEYEDLTNGNIYQTEYVIWSNFPMEKINKDLYTYQLSSEVLARLGMNDGVLTKFHQQMSSDMDYQHELKLIQYDMLYGNQVCWGYTNPYPATDLQFGVETSVITDITQTEEGLQLTGGDYNKWSKVYINGEKVSAKVIDQNHILLPDAQPQSGDVITVCQVGKNNTVYNESPGCMIP